jgi:hypothetical protein
MHGSKHCWERISWILDIHMLLQKNQDLNWNYIQEQAIKLECETMLHLGLELSSRFFKTSIPIQHAITTKLITYVINTFDSLHVEQTELEQNKKAFQFHYALNDTVFQKIKFIYRTIFPINGQDILELNLPNKLYFLYYIIKPFRLLKKYIGKLFS